MNSLSRESMAPLPCCSRRFSPRRSCCRRLLGRTRGSPCDRVRIRHQRSAGGARSPVVCVEAAARGDKSGKAVGYNSSAASGRVRRRARAGQGLASVCAVVPGGGSIHRLGGNADVRNRQRSEWFQVASERPCLPLPYCVLVAKGVIPGWCWLLWLLCAAQAAAGIFVVHARLDASIAARKSQVADNAKTAVRRSFLNSS